MRWPGVESLYGPTLRESDVFAPSSRGSSVEDAGTKRWESLHQRVIEHVCVVARTVRKLTDILLSKNIRVIAAYYTQITLTRLAELLDLNPDAAERTLCKLVTDKTVKAKIDRPAGIVDFKQKQTADQTLNEWSGDLGKMLGLIEKTSHLINKVSLSYSGLPAYIDFCSVRNTPFTLLVVRPQPRTIACISETTVIMA